MLKKSRRNLAACTDIGLIGPVLELLSKAEDMTAGMTIKDLKALFPL